MTSTILRKYSFFFWFCWKLDEDPFRTNQPLLSALPWIPQSPSTTQSSQNFLYLRWIIGKAASSWTPEELDLCRARHWVFNWVTTVIHLFLCFSLQEQRHHCLSHRHISARSRQCRWEEVGTEWWGWCRRRSFLVSFSLIHPPISQNQWKCSLPSAPLLDWMTSALKIHPLRKTEVIIPE